MLNNRFFSESINYLNPKYSNCVSRKNTIYSRNNDIRSEFNRDFNRLLHCNAYRRLKNKTQVFYATSNDHICTRLEHINHVSSVSSSLSNFFGLNTELTNAISIGHDIGHSPFGHEGERILNEILKSKLNSTFWHEKNSLFFSDYYETLQDPSGNEQNLNLTYAVRDGIICHCGEIDEESLFPRNDFIDLSEINYVNQYSPYTWEGCVVKIADKISYLGRDIEDSISLKILSFSQLKDLSLILKKNINIDLTELNNTVLIHNLIIDLCNESSPSLGIKFSKKYIQFLKAIKEFNIQNIYNHSRLTAYKKYANLILTSIFSLLESYYSGDDTLTKLSRHQTVFPLLVTSFRNWLIRYSDLRSHKLASKYSDIKIEKLKNNIVYSINSFENFIHLIIDYISGMTDNFAIKVFQEITSF